MKTCVQKKYLVNSNDDRTDYDDYDSKFKAFLINSPYSAVNWCNLKILNTNDIFQSTRQQ